MTIEPNHRKFGQAIAANSMSLNTIAVGLLGPGFRAEEIERYGSMEIIYACDLPEKQISIQAFTSWLLQKAFSSHQDDWWSERAGIGVNIVEEEGFVSGVVIAFDCTGVGRFSDWIEFCREILAIGFRDPEWQTTDIEKISNFLKSSLAWEMHHSRLE